MQGNFKIILIAILLLSSCTSTYLPGFNFDSFKGTPVEELADAVEQDSPEKIMRFLDENKGKNLVNYQEQEFGHTVLFLAVVNRKYNSVKVLLDNGADLSIKSYADSSDVLMTMCEDYSSDNCDTVMLKILLSHSPDLHSVRYDAQGNKISLLRTATHTYLCLSFFKILIDAGAEIDYLPNNSADDSPVAGALMVDRLDLARYFLIERKAKIPSYCLIRNEKNGPDSISTIRLLNEQDYSHDPKQQKLKEEIISYILSMGKNN